MASTTILSDNGASSGSAGLKETGGNDGTLSLQTTTSGGTATTAIYADTTQQVGIGTSSPGALLNLGGQATTSLRIDATGANGTRAVISTTNSAVYFNYDYGSSGVPIIFAGGGVAGAGTEKMRINAGAPILCLAGGNTSATGTGIAFPATQSASSDVNTLDDYEEGTWTPTFGGNSTAGSATYSTQDARYTKVGRLVTASFDIIATSTITGASGVLAIRGLPFAAVGSNLSAGSGSVGYFAGISGANYTYTIYIDPTATYCIPTMGSGGTAIAYGSTSNIANGSRMVGVITYTAST